jgi:hypothetical protein
MNHTNCNKHDDSDNSERDHHNATPDEPCHIDRNSARAHRAAQRFSIQLKDWAPLRQTFGQYLTTAPFGQCSTSPDRLFGFLYEFTIELRPLPVDRAAITVNCEFGCVLALAGLVPKYFNVRADVVHEATYNLEKLQSS